MLVDFAVFARVDVAMLSSACRRTRYREAAASDRAGASSPGITPEERAVARVPVVRTVRDSDGFFFEAPDPSATADGSDNIRKQA
jgi:hypothetical protein